MVIIKLIAISVVFALVAGAAFAVDVGGAVIGAINVVDKKGAADDASIFGGGLGRIRLEGSGEAEVGIGTVGGWLRVEGTSGTTLNGRAVMEAAGALSSINWDNPNGWTQAEKDAVAALNGAVSLNDTFQGLAWWQPIEQLRIQLGVNKDGHYDASHITRYGFYAQANELNMVTSDGNWGPVSSDNVIFGGYGNLHFGLIITPTDALTINVAIPLNQGAEGTDKQMASTFKHALFQVNYKADFGAIHVTYQGNGAANNGTFFASAFIGLIENLGLEVGLSYTAAKAGGASPLGFGLGATYNVSEQFGIKLRSFFIVPGKGADIQIRADLLPFFAVNESVTVYGDIGFLLAKKENFIWHFAPYVRVGSEWGPGFYAGIRMANAGAYSTDKNPKGVDFSIPVGIIATF
jgi:hypothetical protein